MKRIDLFQLMNAFQDEEFEPEEECFVDRNKVKETVLAQVRQKKRKGRTVLVLAAALAACLALAGWSCGEQIYQFFSGGWVSIGGADDGPTIAMSNGLDENGEPTIISLENGRLWFVADGQRVDVTSQVNENTPYVWTQWEKSGGFTTSSWEEPRKTTAGLRESNFPATAVEGAECSTAGRTSPGRSSFKTRTGTEQA